MAPPRIPHSNWVSQRANRACRQYKEAERSPPLGRQPSGPGPAQGHPVGLEWTENCSRGFTVKHREHSLIAPLSKTVSKAEEKAEIGLWNGSGSFFAGYHSLCSKDNESTGASKASFCAKVVLFCAPGLAWTGPDL